jgi:hypothetical protein
LDGDKKWLTWVNKIYEQHGLTVLRFGAIHGDEPSMDRLEGETRQSISASPVLDSYAQIRRANDMHGVVASLRAEPQLVKGFPGRHAENALVSVIVPAYNAEATLAVALRGIQQQTWKALEIVVVDDASTDGTVAVVEAFAAKDSRVRLVTLPANSGAYAARNMGLNVCSGKFITVHDSDDWSHPEKIEKQVEALIASDKIMVSFSHWVRMTPDLIFGGWRSPENWGSWVHRNVSSLMMKREVFDRLGYWDQVKCSADTEYYYRVIKCYGLSAIEEVLPGVPLSMGRSHPNSLTQQSETSVFTIFGGVRRDYHQAFRRWHDQAKSLGDLYMDINMGERPFPAPKKILKMDVSIK